MRGVIAADAADTSIVQVSGSMSTSTGLENVIGSAFADHIKGNRRRNLLEGRDGNDEINAIGGPEIDTMRGGNDDDVLRGDLNNFFDPNDDDVFDGGPGDDVFFDANGLPVIK